jgi:hypothetical protein
MAPYIPVIVWLASAIVFELIARRRGVTPGLLWRLVVVFLGPFAIPLAFLARPDSESQ